jgi:hypothetical protein
LPTLDAIIQHNNQRVNLMNDSVHIANDMSKSGSEIDTFEDDPQAFASTLRSLLTNFLTLLDYEDKELQESIDLIKLNMEDFVTLIKNAEDTSTVTEKKDAPDFNIFHILRFEHKEVATHSAFLAHLLKSDGFHGQGQLFIDKFLKKIGIEDVPKPWSVSIEKSAGYNNDKNEVRLGRMDIVLSNEKSAIVIENKIYHGDEPYQLWRYAKWIEKTYGYGSINDKQHFRILYLSPRVTRPSAISISKLFKDDPLKLEMDDILCWTYKRDIVDWLSECREYIEALSVRSVIEQYIRMIRRI